MLKNMFCMINLMQHPGIPLPSALHSTPPRQATKTKASKNSIASPVKNKVDNKSTPMQTNPFAADNPNRDCNMQQYLLQKFEEEYSQLPTRTIATQDLETIQDPTILPEARADPATTVGYHSPITCKPCSM